MSASNARAEGPVVHGTVGLAHAVTDPQASELSFGANGSVALELPLARFLGLQATIEGIALAAGDPPADRSIAPRGAGLALLGAVGARFRFSGAERPGGAWLDANIGAAVTGPNVRPALSAHLGYDFAVGRTPTWAAGPYVGYVQLLQPDDTLRPDDARVASLGLHVAFGGAPSEPPLRADRDGDAVFDDEDACPDEAGTRTTDAKTNGCPRRDRDGDTVFDDEDACLDVPGLRTSDANTNGCPPADRDRDGVLDSEDACPDVAGPRTSDPKTNGCPPPDRDKDGVPDGVDACPDVPGPATNDPKTNGCPPAHGPVSVSGDRITLDDRIMFESGSPRVKSASLPLMKRLAEFFDSTPDLLEVDIEGHADEIGEAKYNVILSRQRAESVKKLLVKLGTDPSRLTTHAYGESRPRVEGHAEEQHRQNRRVEFTIVKARTGTAAATAPPPPPAPTGVK